MRLLVASAAACLVLNGCIAVAVSQFNDHQGKSFAPPPDAAMVYLYGVSPCDNTGVAARMRHSQTTLAIYPGTYRYFSVRPGVHNISVAGQDKISIDALPGQCYFIEAEVACDGGIPRFRQRVVDQEQGRSKVRASVLGLGVPSQ